MEPYHMEEIAGVFKALSEQSRLLLLKKLIDHQSCTVTELVELSGLSQANASKHLKLLANAKLVSYKREGNCVYYKIASPMVEQICDICCNYLDERDAETLEKLSRKR
ncbi:MAG: transcriptional regulator [Acidobacteria bacterium]|nr:MAG: transcriptional regulator [Acidobacteriota bacterium]PIE90241.1 MAG: transcriptional regulator [Acidobacteriota bacterium]